jgi:hypothetical protein
LGVPGPGRVAGKPWRDAIDYYEMPNLMRHLGTAAFVVCAYLTGIRPGEVLGMRTGCCPDPAPDADGKVGRHLIHSYEYKTATDEHGNHQFAGVQRDVPWVAITPVVNAIRVLERMVPDGHLLFDRVAQDMHSSRPGTGALKTSGLHYRIQDFIAWANTEAAAHQLHGETIPPDPMEISVLSAAAGLWPGISPVAPTAWSPSPSSTDTYARPSSPAGTPRAAAAASTTSSTSRPSARSPTPSPTCTPTSKPAAVSPARQPDASSTPPTAPRFAGTTITATTARRLLANEDAMLYDNPHALLLCHYKRAQALCHRDGVKDTPSLDHCVPGCGNIIRTDQHATLLRERADVLDTRATHTPQPVGDRLRANASKLRAHADTHDRTPEHSNGALTIVAVALEAGVPSRAACKRDGWPRPEVGCLMASVVMASADIDLGRCCF